MFTGDGRVSPPVTLNRSPSVSGVSSPRWPETAETIAETFSLSSGGVPELDRPLICAFNFPAVALTLGGPRWPELRSYYLELVRDRSLKVRCTLAASVGEMARIIGPEHARADLVSVLWDAFHAEEEEVRGKAIQALPLFLQSVSDEERKRRANTLDDVWTTRLKGWRERESFAQIFGVLSGLVQDCGDVMQRVLMRGLTDPVAAVREEAIKQVCAFSFL